MKPHVLPCLLALVLAPVSPGVGPAQRRAEPQRPALTPRDSALHALNRLAYGPHPGEQARVAAAGVMGWIDRQLAPASVDDPLLAERQRQFRILDYDRGDLANMFFAAQREQRERKLAGDTAEGAPPGPAEQQSRRLAGELAQLAVVRAVVSERQLFEVTVDFWTNHFNVYLAKGADRFLLPDYIERTIRPRAMGKFADLLLATAKSPAMMFYLDNWESVTPGATPPGGVQLRARPLFGRGAFVPRFRDPQTPDSMRRRAVDQMPKGINENYARELLELHTLGVDGGYTQHDVVEVARIFTGWSIKRPQEGADFEFHGWAHDYGPKQVLGVTFPAGHGMDEGVRLLKILASHPATMHHVSRELCQRFVNDEPPDGCVDDAVAAWQHSDGDLREVVRAIVHGPDFWAPENVRAKIKTPLGFVASAARALGAAPDTGVRLAQLVARLGEPLYLHVAPDGYPERDEAWVNSGALLERMNVAVALASAHPPGLTVSLDSLVPATDGAESEGLIAHVDDAILGGTMSRNTRRVIQAQLADVHDARGARALAVGLALGGPEFQRR